MGNFLVRASRDRACVPVFSFASVLLLTLTAASPARADDDFIDYFSETYAEARTRFLAAATAAGGNLEHYRNPNSGVKGEALYTDVATFNLPGASSVLVLGSGTHGIEGFAGSGLQVGLLREGIARSLPEHVGLLFYHALNPYGFSHLRRFNEDNVDLNRNFVDHTRPYPPNEAYDELAWLIEPDSLSTWQNLKARIGIAWYRVAKGRAWLQKAISQGQYNHPRGLFFGGNSESWSNRTIRKIVERHLSSVPRVIVIDVHTGLGEQGAAELITEAVPGDPVYDRMRKWWGERVKSTRAGDSVSPPVSGSLKHAFTRALPNADVTPVSLEFGTYPPLEVFWALRAETHVHMHRESGHPDAAAVKARFRRAFYPDTDDWKRMVWRQGETVVRQALEHAR